jgi:PleD family two-component response regulator
MPGEDFATTFKRADVALYRAKAQGRNCVIMAYNTLSEEG